MIAEEEKETPYRGKTVATIMYYAKERLLNVGEVTQQIRKER
jgi:hypothetical protein